MISGFGETITFESKLLTNVIRHLCRKFLEQEASVTLDCLLKVARPQEAVSRQLRVMKQNSNRGHVNALRRGVERAWCEECGWWKGRQEAENLFWLR